MVHRISLALFILLSLPALAAAQSRDGGRLEELLGVRVGARGVAFAVVSTGCTEKRDFRVEILDSQLATGPGSAGEDPVRVALIREVLDPCRVVPFRETIRFSFRELGFREPPTHLLLNTIDPGQLDAHPR
jgi:hypothetical protein